jgi:hypothetical protein
VESRAATVAANRRQDGHPDPTVEVRTGARHYLDVLRDLHELINPRLYLEIGIGKGSSLVLATGPAVAIDPDPHPGWTVPNPAVTFHRCTSDDFFFFHGKRAFPGAVELAFIDGMHLAEYAYRDFMNVER